MQDQVVEDRWDLKAKSELSAAAYKSWPLLCENSHLVKSRDYWLMVEFLEVYDTYRKLQKDLKPKPKTASNPHPTDPRVHENSNGTVQTSPLANQCKDTQIELRRLASELGLSPTSAANLKLVDDSKKSVIADVLTRGER